MTDMEILSVFDPLGAEVYAADAATYRVLYGNGALRSRHGRDPVGGLCYEVLHGRTAPCPFCTIPLLRARRPAAYRWEYRDPGRGRTFDVTDRLLLWPDGRDARLQVAFDVTERERAEADLRDARRILEHSPVVLCRWKAEPGWPLTFVSKNVSQFGYAAEELLSGAVPFSRLIHPGDLGRVDEEVRRFTEEGRTGYRQEYRMVGRDGSVRWVDDRTAVARGADGRPLGYEGTLLDITERKLAEEALADRLRYEEGLAACSRALVQNDAGALETALEHLRGAARVSRVVLFLNGRDPQEGLFMRLAHEVVAPGVAPRAGSPGIRHPYRQGFERWARALSEGRPVEGLVDGLPQGERERLRAIGVLSLLVLPIRIRGAWAGFIGFDDLTERRLWGRKDIHLLQTAAQIVGNALERTQVEEHLGQVRKLEAVGRLAAGVAHDFNNMLTPILGFADLLRADIAGDDPRASMVEEIRHAALQSRDLVQQLLSFSRRQIMSLKPLDLQDEVRRMEPLLRRTIRESIDLALVPCTEACPVRADPQLLRQILLNLTVNAQDAMPEGGRISIATARVAQDAEAVPGDYVLLEVADNGSGMVDEAREHVFEPFFTTKEHGKGTGLGLATVHGLVRQMNGSISFSSESGRGTTFRIFLPARSEAEPPGEKGEKPAAASPGHGSEVILLVEDNPMVRRLTESMLRRAGYTVHPAAGAAECLEMIGRLERPAHLLLTDVVMPEINGRELYLRAAAKVPGLRVLFMSGYPADVIAHQGILEEGVHLIQKPFTVQALHEKVRAVLDAV